MLTGRDCMFVAPNDCVCVRLAFIAFSKNIYKVFYSYCLTSKDTIKTSEKCRNHLQTVTTLNPKIKLLFLIKKETQNALNWRAQLLHFIGKNSQGKISLIAVELKPQMFFLPLTSAWTSELFSILLRKMPCCCVPYRPGSKQVIVVLYRWSMKISDC